ncbi:MAG: DUF1538 domain-containing protein [Magnetococcales bacterium]|nr:DUF1538 domain-containing protein [Magnetococcales bacterium]
MELLEFLLKTLLATSANLLPIVVVLIGFHLYVLKQPLPNWRKIAIGILYTLIGLVFFIAGLDKSLFPIGELMATQLSDPQFLFGTAETPPDTSWWAYAWIYLFAASVGFATTLAEPALLAVAIKASEVSAGAIKPLPLRIAVACGAAFGIALGTFRIISGIPLYYFIFVGYCVVILQTKLAPRMIVGLAYDSGGVTTSTVTVPLVAALGLGLSSVIPGRNPVVDGFGMIALTCLFPMITVMGYAQLTECLSLRAVNRRKNAPPLPKRCGLGKRLQQPSQKGDFQP